MSLRWRVLLAFAYLVVLAVTALSVPLAIQVARAAHGDFAVQIHDWAERVAGRVPGALREGEDGLGELVTGRPHLGRTIVIDEEGALIADSVGLRPLGEDYSDHPEVAAALAGRSTRFVRNHPNAGPHYVVAVPVMADGSVIGVTRVSQAVSLVEDAVRHRLLFLAGGSLAVLLMVLLVSVLIARSLTRPLHRLGDVATRIGEGELGAQAEESGQREVAEVAAALNSMSRRIEQAMRAQRDFVANASHQLRTPLTGLRLRLEGLVAGGVEGASPALAETDRLARLIDDLLTLVRVGSEPEAPESADLRQAAIDAVDRWSIQASDTGHVLVLEGEDRPHWGTVSAADIAIVADNLIENALKYTPAGTTVTIGVAADEHDGVVLGVRDDGPGMTDEDRERAFERFYRGTRGRAETGTGLGLAIVRQMIERWGGSVDIFDADGTCFEVWVRAAAKSGAAADDTDRIPSLF